MQTVILKVSGMSCMGCVASIKRVLEPVPGIKAVDIALDRGEVAIAFDGEDATLAAARDAIDSAGYSVVSS